MLADGVGFRSSWADSIDEVLLIYAWPHRLAHLANVILFGPFVEEFLYRGLLFGALRCRFPAWAAALISSLAFAGTHFYSLTGFLSVAAFGFVCAMARERTGSLLPCIFAHGLTNLLLFGGEAWAYAP